MAGFPKRGELQDQFGEVVGTESARIPLPGVPIDKDKLKAMIVKYRGNLSRTAHALGVSRGSVKRIAATDPSVKEILEEARERVVDEVEDAFTRRAIAGDTTASIFFLKTRGRDRGYDQDFRADIEAVTRAALSYALNKSRNPAD